MSRESESRGIAVHRATLADVDEILRHRRGMFMDMGYTAEPALSTAVENSRNFIARGLADGSYVSFLACDQSGSILGGGALVIHAWAAHPSSPHEQRRAYVHNVYVYPEYRRKGIARAIMNAIIGHCRTEGLASLWLHASEHGRALYTNLGFVPTNEMKLDLTK